MAFDKTTRNKPANLSARELHVDLHHCPESSIASEAQ